MFEAGIPGSLPSLFLAATVVAPLGADAPDDACTRLLTSCEVKVAERDPEMRRDLWDDFRALQVACEAPTSDGRSAAKALLLYVMLPENSEPSVRRDLAFRVEQRLRTEAPAAPELIAVLDFTSGVLADLGEYENAIHYLEESLERRGELFGGTSEDYARGLLHLATTYGNWSKSAAQSSNRQRAIAAGDEAVRTLWESRGASDTATQEILMQFRALLAELKVEPDEEARLTRRYSSPSKSGAAAE